MSADKIIEELDREIARLQQVRELLAAHTGERGKAKPGRPKQAASTQPAKRGMSPEGRARVAAAQRKRWAAKKQAG